MKNKIFKILVVFLVIIIILLLLLPGFVKRYAINNSKELIGRQIHIEKLKINYFTGTVKVFDFKIMEQDEQTVFSSFDTLIVNTEPYQLFKDKLVLEQFYLHGLKVNAIKKDSIFNFDDLIAFHTSKKDTISNDSTGSEPFHYSLSNIELKDANFVFEDENIDKITTIKDFSFFVPFVGWDQNEKSEAGLKFNFKKEGYFESSIKVNPVDGEFEAKINVHHLYLDPFHKNLAELANINSINGQFNSQLDIRGNINEINKSLVSGHVEINNFFMEDTQDNKFLAAKKVVCSLKEIDVANKSFIIDSLNLTEPYIYFKLDSTSNNLFEIFKMDSASDSSKDNLASEQTLDSTAEKSIYFAVNHFEIKNGITDYTDNLTGSPFNYYLSEIKINADNIISNSKWIDIYSQMLLNNRGTLKAEIGFNPSNPLYANLDISIEKFLLPDINIYTNYYIGHTLLEGDMFYYSNSKITNGNIESKNKLLVKNASLKNTEKGIYTIPLKFALFLLTDKNGDVNLDIPVRGDLKDPTIKVSEIIWTTFKNLIIKIATSPGKLLAGLVGGDPKDIEEITFNYLDTIPSKKNIKQLEKLIEIEQKKEGLKIEMVYYFDEQLQKEAIAKVEAGKIYYNETQKDYLSDEKGFEIFLLNKTASDSLDIKQSYMALTNPKIIDSISKLYSELLISNTERLLRIAHDSTQISIFLSDPKAPENSGAIPTLKINFSVKDDNHITN